MKATETTLNNFLAQPKTQYVIPVYQRNYDWTEDQCKQLLYDIIEVGNSGNTHFIGSIVYLHDGVYTSSDVKQLVIIDGQQRLTTFTILYLALYRFCKENSMDEIGDEIMDTYLSNKYVKNETHKLKLKQSDSNSKAFRFISNHNNTSSYDEYSKVINNYNFFRSQISTHNFELIRDGINRLLFVEISLERGKDDPQRIFESLNSTGLELSQSDLIRNYILMGLEPDEQQRVFERYWEQIEINARDYNKEESKVSDFIRDYLTFKNKKIPNKNAVYTEFKSRFSIRDERFYTSTLEEILQFSIYYSKIINPEKEKIEEISKELNYINRIESNVCFPFILPVYNDYSNEIISKQEFIQILKLVQSFIWRRFIVGLPTHALNKIFMSAYGEVNKSNYVQSAQRFLLKKKSYQRFPNDAEIETNLFEKDIYNIHSRNLLYFLELLENYNNKEFVSIDNPNITIEHIYPQNPDKSWYSDLSEEENKIILSKHLNTISNLTLSGNNGALSNKSFFEKKTMNKNDKEQGYLFSRLWLNKYLQQIDKWNIEEIHNRFQIIFERFKLIWEYPNLNLIDEIDEDEDFTIYNAPDPKNKKLDYFIFKDEKVVTEEVSKMYYHVISKIIEENPSIVTHNDIKSLLALTVNPKDLRFPYPINSSYFIEANIDNNSKFRKLKILLTKLNLEDDLLINFSNNDFEANEEVANRQYWIDAVGSENMKVVDDIHQLLMKIDEKIDLNYTITYVGLLYNEKVDNLLVMHPKREWTRFSVRVDDLDKWTEKLISNNIDIIPPGKYRRRIKFRIYHTQSIDNLKIIEELLNNSYMNRR